MLFPSVCCLAVCVVQVLVARVMWQWMLGSTASPLPVLVGHDMSKDTGMKGAPRLLNQPGTIELEWADDCDVMSVLELSQEEQEGLVKKLVEIRYSGNEHGAPKSKGYV